MTYLCCGIIGNWMNIKEKFPLPCLLLPTVCFTSEHLPNTPRKIPLACHTQTSWRTIKRPGWLNTVYVVQYYKAKGQMLCGLRVCPYHITGDPEGTVKQQAPVTHSCSIHAKHVKARELLRASVRGFLKAALLTHFWV